MRSSLALGFPEVREAPTIAQRKRALRKLLRETPTTARDALGRDRNKIEGLLTQSDVAAQLWRMCKKYGLTEFDLQVFDPDAAFRQALLTRRREWSLEDSDIRSLTWFLAAGPERRQSSLAYRIAATTLDVLAETAALNPRLLVERESTRRILQAVLLRFSQPDLSAMEGWSRVLHHALSSTLDGLVDAHEYIAQGEPWIRHALSAVASARDAAPNGDEFLLGLFRGEGFRQLVKGLLEEGASAFSDDQADVFETILAAVLEEAAQRIDASPEFGAFFNDQWHHLLAAALGSLEALGPRILAGEAPILRETLVAAVGSLSESLSQGPPDGDTFVLALETAVGVIADNPELLDDQLREAWLGDLISSLALAARDQGLRSAFSRDALESYLRASLAALGRHPEILVGDGELASTLVGRILGELALVPTFGVETIADAVVVAAFEAIAEKGHLVNGEFPELVAELAAVLAEYVRDRELSAFEASEILELVIATNASS